MPKTDIVPNLYSNNAGPKSNFLNYDVRKKLICRNKIPRQKNKSLQLTLRKPVTFLATKYLSSEYSNLKDQIKSSEF